MLDWSKYIAVADRFQHKAKAQDREDLNHNITVSLADTQMRLDTNGGGQLSELAMLRIASCRVADYWRSEYRNGRVISLNQVVYEDEEGNQVELIDTLADDKAIDLEAWLDRSVWELGFPKRLAEIVRKRLYGIPLDRKEQTYFNHYQARHLKKSQKGLF
jgi:hypothetical protein